MFQPLVLLPLICYALAAPVAIKPNNAVQHQQSGASLQPRQQRGPRSGPPGERSSGILYPRPQGPGGPQSSFEDTTPAGQTVPIGEPSTFATSSATNIAPQPTQPLSSGQVDLPPSTTSAQLPAPETLNLSSSTSLPQTTTSPLNTASTGLPFSINVPQPQAPTTTGGLSFSTVFTQLPQQNISSGVSQPILSTLTTPFSNSTTSLPISTRPATLTPVPSPAPSGAAQPLRLSLVNNLNSNNARAYVSALDGSGRVVMLQPDGSFYYLAETGSPVPQAITANIAIPLPGPGQSLEIAIPGFVAGARVWFADGTLDFAVVSSINGPALVEPTAVNSNDGSVNTNWGFVELAYVEGYGLFANLSFVDFVGLPFGLQLQTLSAATQTVPGMPRDAVKQVCDRLRQDTGIAASFWADLCVSSQDGGPIRVISPAVLLSRNADAFSGFFEQYVDQVWETYASRPLTINTQNDNGNVACRVVGEELQCDGDNRPYAKPAATDIFGCNSGAFAIDISDNAIHRAVVPRLCAAFNRATLLLDGGDVQPALPPSSYYTARPHNVYSAVVHEVEAEGRGYAFSYDDVAASDGENVAGTVAAPDPQLLTVFVGGM